MSPGCPVSWRMNNIMISFAYVSEHLDFFFKRIATFLFSSADLITINYLFNQIHTYYYNIWCTTVNSILPRPSLQFLMQKKIIITTLKSLFSPYEGMNMCSTVTILTKFWSNKALLHALCCLELETFLTKATNFYWCPCHIHVPLSNQS